MELAPRLIDVDVPADARATVLVLHGGAARRANMRVSPAQLSVLRMVPIARRVVAAGGGELAVFRVLNSRRGWDTHHTPVQDVAWALDEVARRLGRLPTCLVGHSLGGRAALLSAGRPEVGSVAALAPWVYPDDDPSGDLSRTRILIVHGDRDRIADPERSAVVARRLAGRAREVSYVTVPGGTHAMLSHHDAFDGTAARFAATSLLGDADAEAISSR